jgi:hypothetical protein
VIRAHTGTDCPCFRNVLTAQEGSCILFGIHKSITSLHFHFVLHIFQIWSLSSFSLLHTFINEHARQSIFRNIGTGVMQIETGPANHIFSCGADGTMKMRILPDQFSPLNEVLKNDVKFML